MKQKITILCLTFILCTTAKVFAVNWYVDKDAAGFNNGTSWANAWESFADISWSSVSSGDTVYISGGSSRIYDRALSEDDIKTLYSGPLTDLVNNFNIDFRDFSVLAEHWLEDARQP